MQIREFILRTLDEDLGRGDLFARCREPRRASAKIIAKSNGILAGVLYAKEFQAIEDITIDFRILDGEQFRRGDVIATLKGPQTILLAYERSILNILHHASGIATYANRFVKLLEHTDIKLLDTRKTRPLLREFEKYAARMGGVTNHRMGLDDCLMLKDTHLKTIRDLSRFVKKARTQIPFTSKIEMECESLSQVEQALEAGIDLIMCDNMDVTTIRKVVKLRDERSPKTLIEVSGNVTLQTIQDYINTGIDAISSGAIIHQATWVDLSMKMD